MYQVAPSVGRVARVCCRALKEIIYVAKGDDMVLSGTAIQYGAGDAQRYMRLDVFLAQCPRKRVADAQVARNTYIKENRLLEKEEEVESEAEGRRSPRSSEKIGGNDAEETLGLSRHLDYLLIAHYLRCTPNLSCAPNLRCAPKLSCTPNVDWTTLVKHGHLEGLSCQIFGHGSGLVCAFRFLKPTHRED